MRDTDLYDDLRHGQTESGTIEDMSSYRQGDSVADTVVATPMSNKEFIVSGDHLIILLVSNIYQEKFRFWSILGFTSTLMCTWELVLG